MKYTILYSLIITTLCCSSIAYSAPTKTESNTPRNNTRIQHDISGFLINIRGLVGYTIPAFTSLTLPESSIYPDGFSSPVQGGGAVSLGVRFAITSLDVLVPAYMRFEIEYLQRAPLSLRARGQSYGVIYRGANPPDPTNGYNESDIQYGFSENSFKLRTGTQTAQLNMTFDFDANGLVVPYVGLSVGVTIYDIQLSAPQAEYFNPTHSVGNTVYGSIEKLEVKNTEASFLWGLSAGVVLIVNDYISFDLGIRYSSHVPITIGRAGTMQFKVNYNFIETIFGMSVTL